MDVFWSGDDQHIQHVIVAGKAWGLLKLVELTWPRQTKVGAQQRHEGFRTIFSRTSFKLFNLLDARAWPFQLVRRRLEATNILSALGISPACLKQIHSLIGQKRKSHARNEKSRVKTPGQHERKGCKGTDQRISTKTSSREYQAVIAYTVYSNVFKGAEWMNIAAELKKHAAEELQHALIIADQIDYLGGMPTATPKEVKLSEKPEEMLRFDLDNETVTIKNYRERVNQAEALGHYALAEQLRTIISQEQEHQHDLATALGIDVPKVLAVKAPNIAANSHIKSASGESVRG